jgi:GNAT superfamily N-acetyltransferase
VIPLEIRADDEPALPEVLSLYGSVGWTAYTDEPEVLRSALAGSDVVLTGRVDRALVGLARTVSDGASICFVQDLLVRPEYRRAGVGRALMTTLLDRYHHCRQFVLVTERGDPVATAFYRSMGLAEGAENGTAVFLR